MRKLIATVSITLSVAFAFALANAADYDGGTMATPRMGEEPGMMATSTPRMDEEAGTMSDYGTSDQQAGTMGSTGESAGTTSESTSESTTTSKKSESASAGKSCTDASGMTYRKGEKGYDDCVRAMKSKANSKSSS